MKLKLDENGGAVLKDGKPVYVDDKGIEIAVDVGALYVATADLSVSERAAAQKLAQAQAQLKKFDGVDLDTLKKKADGTEDVAKSFQAKLDEANAENAKLKSDLATRVRSGLFGQSKYLAESLAESIPRDLIEARFANNVRITDEGKVEVLDANGNPIRSRSNPANLADFEEGIEALISSHPSRDSMLKGKANPGGGASPKAPTPAGAVTRAQFDQMTPAQRDAVIAANQTIN